MSRNLLYPKIYSVSKLNVTSGYRKSKLEKGSPTVRSHWEGLAWRLFSEVALLARRLLEYYDTQLQPSGLGVTDLRLLLAIRSQPGKSQTQLATLVGLSQGVVSVRLGRLEELGLIERPHTGRRVVSVSLTEKGQTMLEDVTRGLLDTPLVRTLHHLPAGIAAGYLSLVRHAMTLLPPPRSRASGGEEQPPE